MNQTSATQTAGDSKPVIEIVEQSLYEVRKHIYPRSVSGPFASWRLVFVVLTQLLYYGLPWLSWNDRQAVLFDLVQRKFYIFGLVLWPQDVIYLTLLLILSALSLFLFTAVAGRLFCGYACPQTVYTEIFMWIERKVEGDRFARIRLDGEEWPWSFKKWRLKIIKHALWIAIALWTGFTFIGYFTPIKELSANILAFSLGPWQTFWLFFYSFATWGNAGFMREQVCKYMCPYARFQSVMVDKDTFVVTYDKMRGEPRGSRNKSENQVIYSSIIFVLTSVFLFSLFTRNPLRVDVMRDRGALAREVDGRYIENVYRIQLMNSSESPMRVAVKATGLPDIAVLDAGGKVIHSVVIAPASNLLIPVKVSVAINEVISGSHPIQFEFRGLEGEQIRSRDEKSSFIVPR
ncbi:MAG: 4Fe-4S binding protein [Burkholderiaceae bacterium]|nr:4Fe-4S binding protein [Burkholderiaceae bacterium]